MRIQEAKLVENYISTQNMKPFSNVFSSESSVSPTV